MLPPYNLLQALQPTPCMRNGAGCLSRFEFKKRARLLGVHFGRLDKAGGGELGG
jgi:hypothetical protein